LKAGSPGTYSDAVKGVYLGSMTWIEAEARLTPATLVVLPLGAGAKEHGPHLTLANDELLANYFARRVAEVADVVVAPIVNASYYPAFVEYPGSISLRLETARDLVEDVVRSLARFGPRRFYVLNTGVSTVRALEPAARNLAAEGILMRYTDLKRLREPVEVEQARGTHADEVETSMMLVIAPETVDMSKAVRDDAPERGPGPLTRDPDATRGVYSRSGVWGDATKATRKKGEAIVEARVRDLLGEIEETRAAALPGPRQE
jgi:creatinine amidohydrolase